MEKETNIENTQMETSNTTNTTNIEFNSVISVNVKGQTTDTVDNLEELKEEMDRQLKVVIEGLLSCVDCDFEVTIESEIKETEGDGNDICNE